MASLLETPIGEIVATKRNLISVSDTATVRDVLSTLQANNITAVPVAGSASQWLGAGGTQIIEGRSQYIGFVSILDVVLHLAQCLGRADKELAVLAVNLIGQSADSRTLWTLNPNTKLIDAMEQFCTGVHRVLVPIMGTSGFSSTDPEIDGSASKCHILSQSDVVRFLLQNVDMLGPGAQQSVEELGLINLGMPPLSVPLNMPLIDVLRLQHDSGLTTLPVVGHMNGMTINSQPRPTTGGKIIGTLSVSNFRNINEETLKDIFDLTVEDFLKRTSGSLVPVPPVTCRPTTPLATAMASAVTSQVHRIWVTNEDGWLNGVVTFSDMIRAVRHISKCESN